MLLSIAMIVKNEENNLDRCLSALKKLEGKINYEIIIVDTGSEDNTIEIAKKYTTKVYEHQWNNNFADMRNISFGYCKGEWILVLDADEVLENPEEIQKFFNGEHKKYEAAIVKLKNITTKESYSYIGLVRLFKKTDYFCYKGRVHEQPVFKNPVGNTKILFSHYGYSRSNYELMKYKFERNIKLLLQELEDGINKIYTLFQLAQSYAMANEHKKALKHITEAYELVNKEKDKKKYTYIYHNYSLQLYGAGDYNKAEEISKEALKLGSNSIDFYYIIANSLVKMNKSKEAREYFIKYFNRYKESVDGYIEDMSIPGMFYCRFNEVKITKIINSYDNKLYKDVLEDFEKLDEKDKEKLIDLYLYSSVEEKKCFNIFNWIKDKKITDEVIEKIQSLLSRLQIECKNDLVEEITSQLFGLDERLDYFIDAIVLDKFNEVDKINIDFNNFYIWKALIIKENVKKYKNDGINIIKTLKKIDLERYVSYLCTDYECISILHKYSKEKLLCTDLIDIYFMNILEGELMVLESLDEDEKIKLFNRSLINNLKFIKIVYNKAIVESEIASIVMGKNEGFWSSINKVIKKINSNKLEGIKELKELLINNPYNKDVIKLLQKQISYDVVSKEMLEEKRNLISAVQSMINSGEFEEAEKIILELNNIFIYDSEILNTLGIIQYFKGNIIEALTNIALANEFTDDNFDCLYNIAMILEGMGKIQDAKVYYNEALSKCANNEMKSEIKEKINGIR